MGVVNTLSTAVTNADAGTHNNSYISFGRLRTYVGTVAVLAADEDGSVYRFGRIKSSERLVSLLIACDVMTDSTDWKCGVLYPAAKGGGVVATYSDQIFMPTATSLAAGLTIPTEKYLPAIANATATIANMEKRVWELIGLSADPFDVYDIALTANTVGSDPGALSITYSVVS